MNPIYLDYNATTPLDPAVADAIVPFLRAHFGNPSSSHAPGKFAHDAIETARAQVAELIGAHPDEIVFTGSGTEASNLAIKGVFFSRIGKGLSGMLTRLFRRAGCHMITSSIEHPATSRPLEFLRGLGCRVSIVPVDRQGLVDPDAIARSVTGDTALVSIMHSNNEVGTIQPIAEISSRIRGRGVLVHTDVSQSLGKVPIDVNTLGVDLMTIAGHKLYAPKGIGVLYIRRGVRLESLVHGAGHESGRRAGTENVPYIVGLGTACALARQSLPGATTKLREFRDRLWSHLRGRLGERIVLNGHPENRLPNTLNCSFLGEIGAELLARVPDVAASTGSACHEGTISVSPVLCAMGVPREVNQGAVRLSVGRFTTVEEVDRAAGLLADAVKG